ncbi:MAG TPA: AsmA family protein, partial [Alphaproteobacteria bacterium]|nr:AsmA family protein [Alphaproteobacteria bacterium]
MLNRLYIVIGVLAILAIGAAFVVPRFIQWGDYRERMQEIAGEVLGAPVEIVGDIEFSLLPQPQLNFADVKVGDPESPTITVAEVEAQFSLIDFLRDRYLITRLVLVRPSLAVTVTPDGAINAGIALPERVSASNISVASAEIVDGAVMLADARSGDRFEATDVDGELKMEALRGPFSFQGTGTYAGRSYGGRIATSAPDDQGAAPLSLFLNPLDESFSLSAEGQLTAGAVPSFSGELTYRQAPPAVAVEAADADAGRGSLVITAKVQATPARVLLSEYTILPDENRPATRLLGAAEVQLGAGRSFNAVISGGVLALPPRDATADQSSLPYEIVRLLGEIPLPPMPGLPGTVGVDITEVNLRAVSLRNVRFDARTDGASWTLGDFSAQLPGNTRMSLRGRLTAEAGKPTFAGDISVTTPRLDTLSQLWRDAPSDNPLFNAPGTLSARLSLVGETLSVSDAELTIDGHAYPFSAEIGFAGVARHLNLRASLGALDERQSAALFALLPDITGSGQFGVTFPRGQFEIAAAAAAIGGLAGRDLAATGSWEGGVLSLDTLSGELGGVGFDARLTAFGSFKRPELSGTASIRIAARGAAGLARFFDAVETPKGIREWLERSLPAELDLRLDAPSGAGGQGLAITGRAGVADVKLDATLASGVIRALEGSLSVRLQMTASDPAAFTAQLGLGDTSLVPEGSTMRLVALIDGNALNSFETTIRIEGGGESIGFSGNVVAGDLERLSGNGTVKLALSDLSALTQTFGVGGIWLPALNGSARVDFDGTRTLRLSDISATSGGERVSGALTYEDAGDGARVTGSLAVGRFQPRDLLALLAGPAATLSTGIGFWPDGPADIGQAERRTTGRIAITAPAITVGDAAVLTGAAFALTWDGTGARIRELTGALGTGTMTAEFGVCCAGPLPEKQLSGRLTLAGVDVARLVPQPVAASISAKVDAAARFNGTGDSLQAVLAAMTGEGSFTLRDLRIKGFTPAAFDAIASLDDVLGLEPAAVTERVVARLASGDFTAPSVSGGFTIAGGVLRSPNLAIDGPDARLFGSATLRLADLGLSGGFAMSPVNPSGPDGMLTGANARIAANFAGTLLNPVRTFDVAGMVDTIMVRAYEIEVARLEQIRAEEEARAEAARLERERIAAELGARRAAEEEAAKRAA